MPAQNDKAVGARPEDRRAEQETGNAQTAPGPIAVTPAFLLAAAASLMADECAEGAPDTNLWRLVSTLVAVIIEKRGIEDAARFIARVFGLAVVGGPQGATA